MALKALSAISFLLFLSFTTATSSTPCPTPPASPPPVKPSCDPCKRPPALPSCPRDALKLGVCADVLHLLKVKAGTPPKYPCCSLIGGLVDLEAAVCLCTAVKASILGINLNIPIDLTLLLNFCGKSLPSGFKCA